MSDQIKFISKLKGAKVVIFGGSSGIGYAVAAAVVENGCRTIISSSDPTRVKHAVTELEKTYPSASGRISGQVCDLADEAQAEHSIEALFEATGKVDHVVYTAGDALSMVPINAITGEIAKKAGQVRFFSPLLVAKHAPKYLSAGPRSSITFTAGVVAERPIPGWPLVSAYATAMHGLVRALAIDLKPVRVNVVQPGVVNTNIYATSGIPDDMKNGLLADTAQKLPIGKVATAEDVAEAYLYLIRSEAATGQVVNAEGGNLLV